MIKYKYKYDTYLILLLGLLSFGGTAGRFNFGLSLFDFILIISLAYIVITRKVKYNVNFLILLLVVVYGFAISEINILLNNNNYAFLLTEIRFYIYILLLYFISINMNLDKNILSNHIFTIILFYFILYFLIYNQNFPYTIFNDSKIALEFNKVGRYVAPVPIIAAFLLIIHIENCNSKNTLNSFKNVVILIFYIFMIIGYFVTTGGRTVTIISLLPFLLLIKKFRYQVILAISIYLVLKFIPLFLNGYNFMRFQNIFNPLEDGAVNYRIINDTIMLNDIFTHNFAFYFGFGVGSVYNVNISSFFSSFFVDNTFITIWYKFGIIVGILFFILIIKIILEIKINAIRLILILVIVLISLMSYHLITNPVYLFGIFLLGRFYEEDL